MRDGCQGAGKNIEQGAMRVSMTAGVLVRILNHGGQGIVSLPEFWALDGSNAL